MAIDSLFEFFAEAFVQCRRMPTLFGKPQRLRETADLRLLHRIHHSHGGVIVFDHHPFAGPDARHHPAEVAGSFRLRDVNHGHATMIP